MSVYTGLKSSEVNSQREKYGSNKLPDPKTKTGFQFFMETFKDKLNVILLVMMVIFAIMAVSGTGSVSEPAGIAVVLIAIATIGTRTGLKSQKSSLELRKRTSVHFCNVLRDGVITHINTDDIVVGDVVILQAGDAIYADGYLTNGNIKVDNSVLNGESKECRKTPIAGYKYDRNKEITGADYVDQNSLFAGAVITEGEGEMVVTKVGIETENGKTITSIDDIEEQKTSLEMQLEDLADQISKFGYIGAIVITVALLATQIMTIGFSEYFSVDWIILLQNILTILTTALTIVVAAVPEGLPLIINLITAQNAKVMFKNNILAKHTNKIPEAGNIQLLCTDKTGTLTKGILVPVHNILADGTDVKKESVAERRFNANIICNSSAMFDSKGQIVGGNATERALLLLTTPEKFQSIQSSSDVINKQPFNSANKYSAVQIDRDRTYYKGAPEKLLAKAKLYLDQNGTEQPINKSVVDLLLHNFTTKAMRVIATAYSRKPIGEDLPDDLVIISFVAIRDDVREEVPAAVEQMHRAGVQVMMVTGDVLDTAKAIAKDAGLLTSQDDVAMFAADFDKLDDVVAKDMLPRIKVIARATPQTKLRIVRLAQELKLCVGMTGDGTNDAPALKAADVGFSMGSGTDVCKDAGDIIITDDNFVSITKAVLLGRTFMHNVLKFLKFQLPINIGMVVLSVLYPILTGSEALAAAQILVINIVMDSLNSIAFGGEPAKEEYMIEKPIPKGSKLLSKENMGQILISTASFLVIFGITLIPQIRDIFATEDTYLTARFALLIITATVNGFNIRTDHYNLFEGIKDNKNFVKVAVSIFIGTGLLVQFAGKILHCTGMNMIQWATVVVLSLIVIPVDLTRKKIVGGKNIGKRTEERLA